MPISPEQFDQNNKGQDPETPEIRKQRTMEDAKALQGGAEYTNSGRLGLTQEQVDAAKQEMEATKFGEKLTQLFSNFEIGTIVNALYSFASATSQNRSKSAEVDAKVIKSLADKLNEARHKIDNLL